MEEIIFDPNKCTYQEFKKAQYPGYKLRGADILSSKLAEAKKTLDTRRDRLNNLIKSGKNFSKEAIAAQDLYDKAKKNYDTLEKSLTSGEAFTDQSVEDRPFVPTEPDFSFGDMIGRQTISANRSRIPQEKYTNYTTAEEVNEGGSAESFTLTDSLSMVKTDSEDAIIFDDIQNISESMYHDDREVIEAAVDSVHNKRFINSENKKALAILTGSKEAIAVSAEGVQEAINTNLCGKAKKNTIIITNHSGFAELDIDVNGVSLVTKNQDGDFVYKNKYIIRELSNEILPNTENGSPVIIGDILHVLKFYLIRDDSLIRDMVFPPVIADRRIKKEIITLTTKSDEAYIIGYLA